MDVPRRAAGGARDTADGDRAGIRATGTTTLPTRTSLLSSGTGPVVKRGSVGDPVRRVQRALTAALDRKVAVSGVFTAGTTRAVRAHQRTRGLP